TGGAGDPQPVPQVLLPELSWTTITGPRPEPRLPISGVHELEQVLPATELRGTRIRVGADLIPRPVHPALLLTDEHPCRPPSGGGRDVELCPRRRRPPHLSGQ